MSAAVQVSMPGPIWTCQGGGGPLVATAIHQGHELRPEIAALMALDEDSRLREEDPLTGIWTQVGMMQLRVLRSRFEIDLNRPREKAVCLDPSDVWGLKVWARPLPADVIAQSLEEYDAFYRFVRSMMDELTRRHGKIVVFDIHSYNQRREGPEGPVADPQGNPEVNVGTGTMNRAAWGSLIDTFIARLSDFDFGGRHLDVRENIRFKGGYFPLWLHTHYPHAVCTLSLEFKKFFMDEWRGQADVKALESIRVALQSTVPHVLKQLESL